MYHTQWFVVCEFARVLQSGTIDLLGVFERIQVREFPAKYGRFVLAGRFVSDEREPEGQKWRLELVAPDQSVPLDAEGSLAAKYDTQGGWASSSSVRFEFEGLQLPTPGTYTFRFSIGDTLVATHRLIVALKEG